MSTDGFSLSDFKADGHCTDGFSLGLLISRYEDHLNEDAIVRLDGVSDLPCFNRENYQWTDWSGIVCFYRYPVTLPPIKLIFMIKHLRIKHEDCNMAVVFSDATVQMRMLAI